MDERIKVLKELLREPNIKMVDESSSIDARVIRELRDEGLIDAIDASSKNGLCFLKPRINLRGREWLAGKQRPDSEAAHQHPDDIIEVKPSFMGVGINLNALWRRLRGNKT